MKYISGNKRLGLPDFLKFGIEIEADNVHTKEPFGLYSDKSAEYITSKNWHNNNLNSSNCGTGNTVICGLYQEAIEKIR